MRYEKYSYIHAIHNGCCYNKKKARDPFWPHLQSLYIFPDPQQAAFASSHLLDVFIPFHRDHVMILIKKQPQWLFHFSKGICVCGKLNGKCQVWKERKGISEWVVVAFLWCCLFKKVCHLNLKYYSTSLNMGLFLGLCVICIRLV